MTDRLLVRAAKAIESWQGPVVLRLECGHEISRELSMTALSAMRRAITSGKDVALHCKRCAAIPHPKTNPVGLRSR